MKIVAKCSASVRPSYQVHVKIYNPIDLTLVHFLFYERNKNYN